MTDVEITEHLAAILRHAAASLVEQAERRGFVAPVVLKIVDARLVTLRSFTLTEKGTIVAARSGHGTKVCALPLKVLAVDRRQRIARVRIGANRRVEPVEFLN